MGILQGSRDRRALRERIEELEDTVSDLKRKANSLNLEFTELYDKVSHQMSRMAKRYSARAKVDEILPDEIPNAEPVLGDDPISRKILLRRAGGPSE